MSRSMSQSSSVTTTTTSGHSRSLSVKTNTKPSQTINPLPPSDIKLFVTNLKLLDLDSRPDWPILTVQTFSSKNADQKQRISGVEWGLFRLFEIWDPEETSQKLQPFFPPLEPLQSLNLRAALYRSLNELKKNGVVGRESVIRKTMLDECKGDKFFEILALFSTAVLKKVLATRPSHRKGTSSAKTLSTATNLSINDQVSLLPLAIAHKVALTNILKRKADKRRKYSEFERLLGAKAQKINGRIRHSKATPRSQKSMVPEKEAVVIKKQLQDNWIGNQKWLDTMLHGDDVQVEDAFLNRHFDAIWPMVEQGRKLKDAAPEAGLLQDLQSRVQEQETRVQRWKKFHEGLRREAPKPPPQSSQPELPSKTFDFTDHLELQLRVAAPSKETSTTSKPLRPEYEGILSEMEAELSRVSTAKHNQSTMPQLRRRASSLSTPRSPARSRAVRSDSIPKKPTSPQKPTKVGTSMRKQSKEKVEVWCEQKALGPPEQKVLIPSPPGQPVATPTDSDATLIGHASTALRATIQLPPPAEARGPSLYHQASLETSDPLPTASSPPAALQPQSHSPSPPPPSSYYPSEPPTLEPAPITEEEAAAERIISSIGDATPSPVKRPNQPRLSLVERTRMSMAHNSNFEPITESPVDSPPLPCLPRIEDPPVLDRRASLLDRTRLSMAAMSQNPRPDPKKERRSTARQSLFPVNQFDTPRNRRSFQAIEEGGSTGSMPKEDLFSDEVNYDQMFKSRPRVAHSPIFSPDERGEREAVMNNDDELERQVDEFDMDDYDEGVTGVDLGDVDADDDEDGFTHAWDNSPLRRAGAASREKFAR